MSNKCPKCGASGYSNGGGIYYICGSHVFPGQKIKESVQCLLNQLEQERAKNTKMLGIIRGIEWSGAFVGVNHERVVCCPDCEGELGRHEKGCAINTIIQAAKKAGK